MARLTRTPVLRFTYPTLVGSSRGNTAVYTKASIELVKTIKGHNQYISIWWNQLSYFSYGSLCYITSS